MGVKSKILISAIALSLLYGGYYLGIPAAVNIQKRMPAIEAKIKQQTGFNVSVTAPELKMGFLPAVFFKAGDVVVYSGDGSKALEIKNPDVHLKLLPLLLNKVSIDKLNADTITADFSLGKDSKFRLGDYILPEMPESKLNFNISGVSVKKYSFSFFDTLRNKNFLYLGEDFLLEEFSKNNVSFSTKSDLSVDKKNSRINLDITSKLPLNKINENHLTINADVENLDLGNFSEYARFFTKNEIKELDGIINIKAVTTMTDDGHKNIVSDIIIDNLAIVNTDKFKSIYSKSPLKISSNMSTARNGLLVNNMQINSKGIDINLNGKVKNITAKIPDLDNFTININPSRTEAFIPLLPGERNLSPDVDMYALKEHPFYGDVSGQLKMNGNALTPDIIGKVNVTNGYLEHPIKGAPKGADIKLLFEKDYLTIDAFVPASKTENVTVTGGSYIYGEQLADLYIKSTRNVDLKTAQLVLNPLHKILKFLIGPVPVMDINGIGNIDLHVTGNRKKPHAFGQFNFRDAKVSFLEIHNMLVENGAGFLKFNDIDTYFENSAGSMHGKPVKITGTCNLYGVLNFNVFANGQDIGDLLKILRTSPMLKDIQPMVAPIKEAKGPVDFKLNITGEVPDIDNMVFNKNLFAGGALNLLSVDVIPQGLSVPLSKTTGVLNFKNTNADMVLSSFLGKSKIDVSGKITDNKADLEISSGKFRVGDAFILLGDKFKLPFREDFSTITTSFNARYSGLLDKIDLNNIDLRGKIYSNKNSKSIVYISDSDYSLKKGAVKISPLHGTFNSVPYNLNLNVENAFDKNRKISGGFKMKGFNLETLSKLQSENIIPEDIRKELSNMTEIQGTLDINASARNNSVHAFINPREVSFIYQPARMLVKLNSGNISVNNDTLYLNKLNSYVGEMPLLLDGRVSRIFKTPYIDLYVNAKPTQEFFDQFFNNRALYPLKLKGDMLLSSKVTGYLDNIRSKINLDVAENSSLYYMGASIGGADRVVKIYLDSELTPLKFKINDFKYSNLIQSQNNKSFEMEMLAASGAVRMIDENTIVFENMKIKTENPTDAKIFNIIFRKPFMKQGLFSADLTLNGNVMYPKVRGVLDVTSIDVPFYDSTINDIHVDFTSSDVLVHTKGVVLTSDVDFFARMKNDLKPPYILKNVKLELADLNINHIMRIIRDLEIDYQRNNQVAKNAVAQNTQIPVDMSQFRIEDARILADTIKVKNISAEDFDAALKLDDEMNLSVDKFNFKLANGNVNGDLKYNLGSNLLDMTLNLQDADAQIMSEALFDLKGQLYGNMTGNINLSCDGKSQEYCSKTLAGAGNFVIKEGKMPKLGSLEYLLKAGNLITGGLRGLSINGIIDLITPLKTGEFDDISGDIVIKDGIIYPINIYSRGRDLNIYLTGEYNILSAVANMQVYGNLSRNMSTVFGKIKNASLNSLLNTLPFMNRTEIDEEMRKELEKIPNTTVDSSESRIFAVEVEGNINGDAYVKSFKWVK